jgi:hypothetical protein
MADPVSDCPNRVRSDVELSPAFCSDAPDQLLCQLGRGRFVQGSHQPHPGGIDQFRAALSAMPPRVPTELSLSKSGAAPTRSAITSDRMSRSVGDKCREKPANLNAAKSAPMVAAATPEEIHSGEVQLMTLSPFRWLRVPPPVPCQSAIAKARSSRGISATSPAPNTTP